MHIDSDTLFRMCADQTRLRVLMLLQQEGELCVCENSQKHWLSRTKRSRDNSHNRE